ncbi:MAG: hypothetical protein U9R58_15285 [Chloroflexota bacterium]|nr:hypothetical protein [Chloroflexota bacterium]
MLYERRYRRSSAKPPIITIPIARSTNAITSDASRTANPRSMTAVGPLSLFWKKGAKSFTPVGWIEYGSEVQRRATLAPGAMQIAAYYGLMPAVDQGRSPVRCNVG